jgi:hypothetical protein
MDWVEEVLRLADWLIYGNLNGQSIYVDELKTSRTHQK